MSPTPLLLLLIATLHAAIAHIWQGKSFLQLPLYWLAALIGTVVIYATGVSLSANFPAPAGVHLVEVSLGAWIGLLAAIRTTK
jgi:hypothetical protein